MNYVVFVTDILRYSHFIISDGLTTDHTVKFRVKEQSPATKALFLVKSISLCLSLLVVVADDLGLNNI